MHTIKKLILFITLFCAPKLQAMAPLRRATPALTNVFKSTTAAELPKPTTFPKLPQPTPPPIVQPKFGGYRGDQGGYEGGYQSDYKGTSFKQSSAVPFVGLGALYSAYDRLKGSLGYMPSLTPENVEKYPEYKEQFIKYALEHIDTLDPLVLRALVKKYPESLENFAHSVMQRLKDAPSELDRSFFTTYWDFKDASKYKAYKPFISVMSLLDELLFIEPQVTHAILRFLNEEEPVIQSPFRPDTYVLNDLQRMVFSKNKSQQMITKVTSALKSDDAVTIDLLVNVEGPSLLGRVYNHANTEDQEKIKEATEEAIERFYPNILILGPGPSIDINTGKVTYNRFPFWATGKSLQRIFSILRSTDDHAIDVLLQADESYPNAGSSIDNLYIVSNQETREKINELLKNIITRRTPHVLFLADGVALDTKTGQFLKRFAYPAFVYQTELDKVYKILDSNNDKSIDALLQKTKDRISFLDLLYNNAEQETKEKLEELMHKIIARRIPNFIFLPEGLKFDLKTQQLLEKGKYPLWAYRIHHRAGQKPFTQSEAHLRANLGLALPLLKQLPADAFSFFAKVHRKELKEKTKGNYVFYHAQTWPLHFNQDIYKHLWNIAKNDSIGDDFTFLRFNEPQESPDARKDCLFMNQALLGNAGYPGSCTAQYFFNNMSIYESGITPKMLFEQLGMTKYYNQYEQEFSHLSQMHSFANEGNKAGNLLLVSIPADKMQYVRAVAGGGRPRVVKTIDDKILPGAQSEIDLIIKNPKTLTAGSNFLEYTLPITTEFALDPHHGPKIYDFNAADPQRLHEYKMARDALFAKIRKDYEADQATVKK